MLGLLGHFTTLEVASSEKTPALENVHLHSIVALDRKAHRGDNYITYEKWADNWKDVMQGLARDADVQRARNAAHVIDYVLKYSISRAIDRVQEALVNPTRYVERVRQLWHYRQHWSSGHLARPVIAAIIGPDFSGLDSVKGFDLEYQMAKTSRPRTKNQPIPIDGND